MSGSPKYSAAEIDPRIAQEIAASIERERAAEAERSRRRAEEEYRRQVVSAQTAVLSNIRSLSAEIHQHRQASYGQWASGLAHLTNLDALADTAESSTDLTVLEGVRHQVDAATTAVQRIVIAAQKAEQAELVRVELERKQGEALAAFESVQRAIAETDPQLAAKFDPSGVRELQSLTKSIQAAITDARFDTAMDLARSALADANHHRNRVNEAERNWLKKRQAARATLHETEAALRAAAGDRIVVAWRMTGVGELAHTLDGAAQAIDREAWDSAATIMTQVRETLVRITAEAVKREEEEAKRRYIATSVIAVLNDQGFYTDEPRLLTNDPNSDVIIQATRSDQRSLQIGIMRQARVRYEVDGSERVLTPTPDGQVAQECPEAESAILALHKQLEKDFGINMGELSWDHKPLDVSRVAASEPTGTYVVAQRGGTV